jgi:hypothetical protein
MHHGRGGDEDGGDEEIREHRRRLLHQRWSGAGVGFHPQKGEPGSATPPEVLPSILIWLRKVAGGSDEEEDPDPPARPRTRWIVFREVD